jgi:hypothetical protein
MLKKLSLVLSVLATLGFAVAISAPADAKEQKQSSKSSSHVTTRSVNRTNVRVNTRTNIRTNKVGNVRTNVRTNRISSSSSKFIVGHRYGNRMWFGHNRHNWHGRWYDYGVGECWINIDDEWFWNELVCPL